MEFSLPWSVIWPVPFCLAGIAGLLTKDRAWFCAMPGAFAAFILSLFPRVPWWVQLAVALWLIAVAFVLCFTLFRKGKRASSRPALEDLIGKSVIVTAKIENLAGNGEVQADGFFWAARAAEEDRVYEIGAAVTVIAVEGVKLICK